MLCSLGGVWGLPMCSSFTLLYLKVLSHTNPSTQLRALLFVDRTCGRWWVVCRARKLQLDSWQRVIRLWMRLASTEYLLFQHTVWGTMRAGDTRCGGSTQRIRGVRGVGGQATCRASPRFPLVYFPPLACCFRAAGFGVRGMPSLSEQPTLL